MESNTASAARARTRSTSSYMLGPVRARIRLVLALGWILLCYLLLQAITALGAFSKPMSKRLRKAVSLLWIRGARRIIGMRLMVNGAPPSPPFFLVINHIAWIDFFGICGLIDAVCIAEEPMRHVPLLGTLMAGLDPIFVRRVKEDTPRVKALMVQALQEGQSLVMAPETPETTIPRGSGVRMFRGGLLDAAVIAGKPVHYLSITYRTPDGYLPPSKALVFGPNPHLRTADGKIPKSEFAMYERQTFMQHLMKVLALPYFEFVITFGAEPVTGRDRIDLANKLHDAVESIFTPIE